MKAKEVSAKVRGFFSNKRNLIVLIIIVTLIIVALVKVLLWMIYTQDKPDFVPEETKGKIRKGIEENIGGNVKKVAPDLGQAIIDASWDKKNGARVGDSTTVTSTTQSSWSKIDFSPVGRSIYMPSTYAVWQSGEEYISYAPSSDVTSLQADKLKYLDTDATFWGGKSITLSVVHGILAGTTIEKYLAESFDPIDVATTHVNYQIPMVYVEDAGPNRFGGGRGYYYFFSDGNDLYEISLDFFGNQSIDLAKVSLLKEIAQKVK